MVVDRVSSINDLGVIMDEKMNFSEHVDGIVDAAMREFNEVIGLFDFILTRNQFMNCL
jgi:hypothetical protein